MGKDNLMNLWYNALTLITVVTKATPAIKHSLVELKK